MRLYFLVLLLWLSASAGSQIVTAEYFYNDATVRYGQGTQLTVPSNTGSVTINTTLSVDLLKPGFNIIYFRMKDATKGWTPLTPKVFLKQWPKDTLTGFKYCIDPQLPGTVWQNTSFSSPSIDVTETKELNLGGISKGVHFIEVMAKTHSGTWTPVSKGTFFNLLTEPANIVKFEYFFEKDGVPTAVMSTADFTHSASVELDSLVFAIPAGSLENTKLYTIFIRGVNELGDRGFYYCDTIVYHAPKVNENSFVINREYIVYPNPAKGYLNLRFLNNTESNRIKAIIVNSAGMIVLEKEMNFEEEFNLIELGNLPSGNYVMQLSGEKGEYLGTAEFIIVD